MRSCRGGVNPERSKEPKGEAGLTRRCSMGASCASGAPLPVRSFVAGGLIAYLAGAEGLYLVGFGLLNRGIA